jgi:PAS domain S-box-containing protein
MNGDPPTLVIVDDAPDVRMLVKTRLRLSGRFDLVGEGGDGSEAVALAQQYEPDLMLLDVSMPGVDGLEALPQVLAVSPSTLVVLFSGFEEQGLVEKARQLGAAAFIEKSAPIDAVIERLLAVLGRGQAPTQPPSAPQGQRSSEPRSAGTPMPDEGVLDEHLERFREVFEEAAIGMGTMTLTGRLVRVNRAFASMLRRPAPELVGVFYGELTEGRDKQVSAALEEIRLRPVDVVQLEHGIAGAGDREVRATLAPVRDSDGRPLYLFLQVQDVTAETVALDELRRSEERFRLLVEAVEDYAIFMLDPTGHIVSWNTGAQRSKGYTAEEIIGQHFRVFYPPEVQRRKHPEYELGVALREGHYEEEGWRVRKDGSQFWANVLITAVFNDAGEHMGFTKVTRDTTERRRMTQEREHAVHALATAKSELEALNARLQQAAEDQAQFLAVTAHELRTPIGVLGGSAEMLSRHWRDLTEDERNELLEAMTNSTGRLRRLLTDLLTASRLEASALDMNVETVLVGDAFADAIATVRGARPDSEVDVEVQPGTAVSADRDRLAQMLDNLLANALRHGEPPVRLTADVDTTWVSIRVADSGTGVPADLQDRLFTRFATGRSRGGTGLGLFIVREIARAHGGDAVYEPASAAQPSGAFVVTLPRAEQAR